MRRTVSSYHGRPFPQLPSSEGYGPLSRLSCQVPADLGRKFHLGYVDPPLPSPRRGLPWRLRGGTGRPHALSHRTLALSVLSCRVVGHWFARMLLTPTRLSRMAVPMGSSKASWGTLRGPRSVGPSPPRPHPKQHQLPTPKLKCPPKGIQIPLRGTPCERKSKSLGCACWGHPAQLQQPRGSGGWWSAAGAPETLREGCGSSSWRPGSL